MQINAVVQLKPIWYIGIRENRTLETNKMNRFLPAVGHDYIAVTLTGED